MKKGLIAFFGNKDVSKITTNHIREFFLLILMQIDPSPYRFLQRTNILLHSKIFRVAYEFNVIDKIPLLPKIDVGRKNKDNLDHLFRRDTSYCCTIRLCESKEDS